MKLFTFASASFNAAIELALVAANTFNECRGQIRPHHLLGILLDTKPRFLRFQTVGEILRRRVQLIPLLRDPVRCHDNLLSLFWVDG
jgi:hypothetical protein